jgi:hypothetical protein
MNNVRLLPTSATCPVGPQRISGRVPVGVVPAKRLTILRREVGLRAARTARSQAEARAQGHRLMMECLDAFKLLGDRGDLEGLVFIAQVKGHGELLGAAGCYEALEDRCTTRKRIAEALDRARDRFD